MKKELLEVEKEKMFVDIPLLDFIYIIPTRRKHDSGYTDVIDLEKYIGTRDYWLSLYESDTDTVVMSKDKWEEIKQEIERLNNIIKNIEKCIDYYAIENDDFSKFYNNEEIEILKIIGSDKE